MAASLGCLIMPCRPPPITPDCAALLQVLYAAFTQLVHSKSPHPLMQQARPVLRQVLHFFEASLGPATNFTPSTTHVILVCVLLPFPWTTIALSPFTADAW